MDEKIDTNIVLILAAFLCEPFSFLLISHILGRCKLHFTGQNHRQTDRDVHSLEEDQYKMIKQYFRMIQVSVEGEVKNLNSALYSIYFQ